MINDFELPRIGLQQLSKTAKHKLNDTLIQWNEHNIPEFSTTPTVFFCGMTPVACWRHTTEENRWSGRKFWDIMSIPLDYSLPTCVSLLYIYMVENYGILRSFHWITESSNLCFVVIYIWSKILDIVHILLD